MSCADTRRYGSAALLSRRDLGGAVELSLAWRGERPLPGQFFMLKPERFTRFLGRAISVFGAEALGGGWLLRFLVAPRGAGSAELAALSPGERVLLSGPSGRPWPDEKRGVLRLALVSGGVGIAPLAFLARGLSAGSFDLHAGFRSAPFGIEGLKPGGMGLWSEDGSSGNEGFVTQGFDASAYDLVYACGPQAMLEAVARACAAAGAACWLSLERRMACGVGACLGCVVRTHSGNRRCCVDGPVFAAKELCLDEC